MLARARSPLVRCYGLGGYTLSLGTVKTTVMHLAEHRVDLSGCEVYAQGSAMLVDGRREWVEYRSMHLDNSDFEQLRQNYMEECDNWSAGDVCYAESRLFPIRPLVDFAAKWLQHNRK